MPLFSLAELEAALPLVRSVVPATPQHAWPLLARRTGAQVWVKHENHTPIGAFKIRGGVTYLDALKRSGRQFSGVVTATRGNHGQSIALAAARAGLPCTIFVPHGNSREKNAAMQALGAELIVIGSDFDACRPHAAEFADRARLSLRALVPRRSGQGGRHLCARAVFGSQRSRCRLRADRHGLGDLWPHLGPRPVGLADAHHRRGGRRCAGRCPLIRAGAGCSIPMRRPPSPTAWPAACPRRSPSTSSGAVRPAWSASRRTRSPKRSAPITPTPTTLPRAPAPPR